MKQSPVETSLVQLLLAGITMMLVVLTVHFVRLPMSMMARHLLLIWQYRTVLVTPSEELPGLLCTMVEELAGEKWSMVVLALFLMAQYSKEGKRRACLAGM